MSERPVPDLELDDLMLKIRAEVARRRAEAAPPAAAPPAPPVTPAPVALPAAFEPPRLACDPPFVPPQGRPLRLEDLAAYHDEAFVAHAYRALLHREPDRTGGAHFLDQLRRGTRDKVEILWSLHRSPEGRALGVPIRGLAGPARMRRVFRAPVVGPLLRWVRDLLTLPRRLDHLHRVEAHAHARWNHLEHYLAATGAATAAAFQDHREAVGTLREAFADHARRTADLADRLAAFEAAADRGARERDADRAEAARRDGDLAAQARTLRALASEALDRAAEAESAARRLGELAPALEGVREAVVRGERSVAGLERTVAALRTDTDREALRAGEMAAVLETQRERTESLEREIHGPLDDALYADLEDRFRGTREDIRARAEVYLPLVQRAAAGVPGRPLLDLGCGRCEWLELLSSRGLEALGVDRNGAFVRDGVARGLRVEEEDALSFLRSRGDGTAGAVTAFHVLEHLSLADLQSLLAETFRVLAPGGLALFETPDPANLAVGAHTFYLDPTHRRPLPSALLNFLAERVGFVDLEVMSLHPPPASALPPPDSGLPPELLAHFACAQDYALVGWKR